MCEKIEQERREALLEDVLAVRFILTRVKRSNDLTAEEHNRVNLALIYTDEAVIEMVHEQERRRTSK